MKWRISRYFTRKRDTLTLFKKIPYIMPLGFSCFIVNWPENTPNAHKPPLSSLPPVTSTCKTGFCILYWLFFYLGFTAFSRIFHISSWSFIKFRWAKNGEPGKKHLTIRKQNLAFPHVTRARLEPQQWEIEWIKSQLSYPLGYGARQMLFELDGQTSHDNWDLTHRLCPVWCICKHVA